MRETLFVLLFLLPKLSLQVEYGAPDLLNLCNEMSVCQSNVNRIQKTISPALILEICKSSHKNVESTCVAIIERALEIDAELPVDYLKEECFGSSLKKRLICQDIRTKCEKYTKSESCYKIIPQNQTTTTSIVEQMIKACRVSETSCRNIARTSAKDVRRWDMEEICETDESAGELACRHIIRESIRTKDRELKVEDWKGRCTNNNIIFCEEIVLACEESDKSGNKEFCDELAEAQEEIKKENTKEERDLWKLYTPVLIGLAGGVILFFSAWGICWFCTRKSRRKENELLARLAKEHEESRARKKLHIAMELELYRRQDSLESKFGSTPATSPQTMVVPSIS